MYAPPRFGSARATAPAQAGREIVNVLVLVLLVVVLLFVATKFKWVHCSQVPFGWCDAYCSISGSSRVALVTGPDGMGDAPTLKNLIEVTREPTLVELFNAREMSAGLLRNYDLLILQGFRNVSDQEASALKSYIAQGGAVLWVGDAASQRYLSAGDLAAALQRNQSDPGYYEYLVNETANTQGFGELGDFLRLTYLDRHATATGLSLRFVDRGHIVSRGIVPLLPLPPTPYATVNERAGVTKIAVLQAGGREYPGITETNIGGRIVYSALPLEKLNSTTLLTNMLDYLVAC